MKLAAGEEEAEARDLSLALVRGKGAAMPPGREPEQPGRDWPHPGDEGTETD